MSPLKKVYVMVWPWRLVYQCHMLSNGFTGAQIPLAVTLELENKNLCYKLIKGKSKRSSVHAEHCGKYMD